MVRFGSLVTALSFVALGVLAGGCSSSSSDETTADDNLTAGPATGAQGGPLCRPSERTVFSCRTENRKIIAVCASIDIGPSTGYLQYRFGTDNQTELKLPEDAAVHNFRQTSSYYGGREEDEAGGNIDRGLQFIKGPYAYTVYQHQGHGWEGEGVRVTKDGNQIADVKCNGDFANAIDIDAVRRAGVIEQDI